MSKKAWIIFAGVCIAILAGLVYFSSKDKVDVSNVKVSDIQSASPTSGNIADHVFSTKDSKVVLVEYGDFQCPGCGNAHPTVKNLTEKYKDQLTFVFRNFPLTSIHPNAKAAAAAAEAAGIQGKYWPMHNMLFEGQSDWGSLSSSQRTDFFANYAKDLGLNVDTFKTDLGSDSVSKKINYDLALGKEHGANSTPSFYLNGTLLTQETWGDETKFETAIIDELKKNGITLPEKK